MEQGKEVREKILAFLSGIKDNATFTEKDIPLTPMQSLHLQAFVGICIKNEDTGRFRKIPTALGEQLPC